MSYIYVIEFDSGLIKVGRTSRPQQRITSHKGNVYNISRAEIINQWVSCEHTNPGENERKLISYCEVKSKKTGKRSEWFNNVNFADVVSYAEGLFYDQTPRARNNPEIAIKALEQIFGNTSEKLHVSLSYRCAESLQKFIVDSLWIGGEVFVVSETFGATPFVLVVGAYFASGSPTDMLVEAMAEISIDPEKELEAVYGLFDEALSYAKLWAK